MMLCWCRTTLCLLITASTTMGVRAQVLTAEDLSRAGVLRLSDILELADDWSGSSTEGYHWDIAPLGTSWEASPEWSLFIDGQLISLRALNRQSLNTLPIALSEICEIRLNATPVLINGVLAHGGAVQITMCKSPNGLSLRGQVGAGNETGDPGPYKYTDLGGSNVDRTGPTAEAALSVSSSNWHYRGMVAADEHHVTDPRIRPRVLQLYRGEKDARIIYRAFGFDGSSSGFTVNAATSRIEDLLFTPVMGREIPVDRQTTFVTMSSARRLLGYSISGNSTSFTTRENPESIITDFVQQRAHARLHSTRSLGINSIEFGAGWLFAQAQFGPEELRHTLYSYRGDATLSLGTPNRLRMRTMAALSLDDRILGYEVFSRIWHDRIGLDLRVMLRNRAPAAELTFADWATRGFRPGNAELRFMHLDLPRRRSTYSLDLAWTTGNQVKLYLNGGLRRLTNHVRPRMHALLDSTRTRLHATTDIVAASGQIARASGRIYMPLTSQFTVKLYGVYAYPWSDSDAFRSAWYHRMQVGGQGEFHPNDRLSLNMRLRYVGATTWAEYEEAAADNPEFYTTRLPGAVYLHLTVQKRFWGERLRLSATMRNVLDHPHLAHPAGARTHALFQVAMRYAFQAGNAGSS
ncbi:MAG: hypothetical protein F4Y90_04140 [Rhodothermaceae bacterium]|nr:hypothetical protein [Rhodothermaceae bacterium]MYF40006.1 hypothetical protein [Rhodothermaceae bacterium]